MKTRMLDLLCCPGCSGLLKLEVFSQSDGPAETASIEEGTLNCLSCGRLFPICEGVPRVYLGAISEHRDFVKRRRMQLPEGKWIQDDLSETKDVQKTKVSFSREWQQFEYSSDKTWDWDVEEQKSVFLKEMGMKEDSFKGKLLLDAGCGNGVLTSALADFGLEVVGMDLSDSVVRAHRHNTSDQVHFVQGNVMRPPFRKGAYDLIYSSGVLHHTPDTRKAFGALSTLIKGGGRTYVWLYGTSKDVESSFWTSSWRGRGLGRFIRGKITSRLPHLIQHGLYIALAVFRKTVYPVVNALKIRKLRAKKWSEQMVESYDFYSAPYQHLHTDTELSQWFAEEGFENITLSESRHAGFGVYGDLKRQ